MCVVCIWGEGGWGTPGTCAGVWEGPICGRAIIRSGYVECGGGVLADRVRGSTWYKTSWDPQTVAVCPFHDSEQLRGSFIFRTCK